MVPLEKVWYAGWKTPKDRTAGKIGIAKEPWQGPAY